MYEYVEERCGIPTGIACAGSLEEHVIPNYYKLLRHGGDQVPYMYEHLTELLSIFSGTSRTV
jgi:hypothetical protein